MIINFVTSLRIGRVFLALASMMCLASGQGATKAEGTTGMSATGGSIAEEVTKGGDVSLSNDRLRVVFHRGHSKFGVFPTDFTGYSVLLKTEDRWTTMAHAPYFSSYVVRTRWGRDFLHYVVPALGKIENDATSSSVTFEAYGGDLDGGLWTFNFRFTLAPGRSWVETNATAMPNAKRELLLFWGPRLHAGEGTFGARKDEALFAGLEYLGPKDRSSNMWALAPDAQMNFVPHPAKVSIPLMCIVDQGNMVGLMWDPTQKWLGQETCPSAAFASPNWLESQENHLLGLFLPSIPDYVPENGLRASKPVTIESSQTISLSARIFAAPGKHVTDAVKLYVDAAGGLPAVQQGPMSHEKSVEFLVRALVNHWDAAKKGWAWENGSEAKPNANIAWLIERALPILKDRELAAKAKAIVREALASDTSRTLGLALLEGGVATALTAQRAVAEKSISEQKADGSWVFNPTKTAEEGLRALQAPPEPGMIAAPDTKSQGISAQKASELLDFALVSGDAKTLAAALRGLDDMERYAIPSPYGNDECPASPSLHGSYFALRGCMLAYKITGDRKYVERAKYWALTGMPFVYLWSLPARDVPHGQLHGAVQVVAPGGELYVNTKRDPMLYGALYGYGSSQFMHHWYGMIVHWIGMVYAETLVDLAEADDSFPWKTVIDGIVTSGEWQNFDKPPYDGYFPDTFNLVNWIPSGPAFSPAALLRATLWCKYDLPPQRTVVAREGEARRHITTAGKIADAKLASGNLQFSLHDPDREVVRAVVSGTSEGAEVRVDGKALPMVADLESKPECCARMADGLLLIKMASGAAARKVEIGGAAGK